MLNDLDEDVRIEASLLKILSERGNFNLYYPLINKDRLLHNTKFLLKDYEKYFQNFEHDKIDWGEFITQFSQNWHVSDLDEDDILYYRDTVIPYINKADSNEINNTLIALLNKNFREQISQLTSGDTNIDLISDAINRYREEKAKILLEEADADGYTIDQVVEEEDNTGIPWFLPKLRENNGNIKLGDFIIVFAYNEVGKGAFAVSQVAKTLLSQPGKPILYFTSEDAVRKLYGRIISCLWQKSYIKGFHEVMDDFDNASTQFIEKFGKDSLRVYELGFGELDKINREIDKHDPCLVVIDMADTLCPETEDPMTIKRVYDSLRQIANRKCPVMATSQANDTSYYSEKEGKMVNKQWLSRNDCYGSKVGKPSAATMMIGIAEDLTWSGRRYIHTPKNKEHEQIKVVCDLVEKFSYYQEV